MSRTEVSRICAGLDAEVAAFRGRSLAGEVYPYVWLDATYLKVREAGRNRCFALKDRILTPARRL